ncbi:sensor histidine kinase KdpD [Massilia sp. WG5]|uniref:sensor histidine kinase n=1 Tax=Massilia sp. WG5 TaxID=1707785 RepID=UPI0009EA1EA6|nr:HAMP domain-containing sensor histidine kinase [Massilia sp. WG5]
MSGNYGDKGASAFNSPAKAFSALKAEIMNEWQVQVRKRISVATELSDSALQDTVHVFYDNVMESLSGSNTRSFATEGTNISYVHGRERAGGTNFTISNVLQELYILKRLIVDMSFHKGIHLTRQEILTLDESFDRGIAEASDGYVNKQRENYEIFVAGISHDIRNPIQVALSAAQVIQMRTAEQETADLNRRVCSKLIEVGKMVDSLLDTAAFNNRVFDTLKITKFDMCELVKEVAEDLTHNRAVIQGNSITGFWSRDQMKRVLENLLSNAEKYGVPGGDIEVSFQVKNSRLALSVHNEGEPIPKEHQKEIFATFQRWHEGEVRGWGLGLSMARAVVESHGGSIIVDSSTDKGTTFTIDVPIDCRDIAAKNVQDKGNLREPHSEKMVQN